MRAHPVIRWTLRNKVMAMLGAIVIGAVVFSVTFANRVYIKDALDFILVRAHENSSALKDRLNDRFQVTLHAIVNWKESGFQSAYLSNQHDVQEVWHVKTQNGLVIHRFPGITPTEETYFDLDLLKRAKLKKASLLGASKDQKKEYWLSLPSEDQAEFIFAKLNWELFTEFLKSDGLSQVVLFNSRGDLYYLSHQEGVHEFVDLATSAKGSFNAEQLSLLKAEGSQQKTQENIPGSDKSMFVASWTKTSLDDLSLGVFFPQDKIYETPRKVAWMSFGIALIILTFSFIVALYFSDSLVKPILKLMDLTKGVAQGNYADKFQIQSQDELAVLGRAFNDMTDGLAERERIKNIFGKFHSKTIVDKLMSQEKLKLGGNRIPVTVFFSDIRSFTTSSEMMAPEEVVRMLNEYFTKMVAIVEEFDGVVDKYVGDAIMAVWGHGEETPEEGALKALRASLKMRSTLAELNERREARGQKPIHIGIGLHSGSVVAGTIGSPDHMEYTVIGDTVNTCSRIESLTKEFQTDLLLSENTKALLPNDLFQLHEAGESKVKGRKESVRVFKCAGEIEKQYELKAA